MSVRSLLRASARLASIVCFFVPLLAIGQTPGPTHRIELALGFEGGTADDLPRGWIASSAQEVRTDAEIRHSGQRSLRIARTEKSPGSFSTSTMVLPMTFAGSRMELSGYLRTEDVQGRAALWVRQDGDRRGLVLETMRRQPVQGNSEWARYTVAVPIHSGARRLFLGVLLEGTGTAWADDLQITIDGRPIADLDAATELPGPAATSPPRDAPASGVVIGELRAEQVANLALLGRVWGFLKYHHSAATSGARPWDPELFRILPKVLHATSAAEARAVLVAWIDEVGEPAPCSPCVALDTRELQLRPSLDWLADRQQLGAELSERLMRIYRNRVRGQQFYVSLAPTGQATFDREPHYGPDAMSDAGYRLLALFRYWNIIEYWFPYRNLIEERWTDVLEKFIPRVAAASDIQTYQRVMLSLVASVHDSHANLWNALDARPPAGQCRMALDLRFIGPDPVVLAPSAARSALPAILPGDVVEAVDGVAVGSLVREWRPYYAASNEAGRMLDIGRQLTRGPCGTGTLRVRRGTDHVQVVLPRSVSASGGAASRPHDLPGDTFRILSAQIAYLKLSSLKVSAVPDYMSRAAGTRGLIIDLRGYPAEFVLYEIGGWLVTQPTPFSRITKPDLSNPGSFYWNGSPTILPGKSTYRGEVLVLVDESSMSQAEFTALALRAAPRVKILGSTTAGADGNIASIQLPGGLNTAISGIGVFRVDGSPTQRVGIVPDIPVAPTIAGIREGRDEVV